MAHHRRVALLCVALLARARGLLPPRPRARRLTVPRASPGPESLARDAEDAGRRRRGGPGRRRVGGRCSSGDGAPAAAGGAAQGHVLLLLLLGACAFHRWVGKIIYIMFINFFRFRPVSSSQQQEEGGETIRGKTKNEKGR